MSSGGLEAHRRTSDDVLADGAGGQVGHVADAGIGVLDQVIGPRLRSGRARRADRLAGLPGLRLAQGGSSSDRHAPTPDADRPLEAVEALRSCESTAIREPVRAATALGRHRLDQAL